MKILANLWVCLFSSETVGICKDANRDFGYEGKMWVKSSLQCSLFCMQEVSYNISITNGNCLQLPLPFQLWWGFFSLGRSGSCVYPTSHGHHLERRMLGLCCTTYCTAFAVGTVVATKGLKDWKGNLQSFCPVMTIVMNANYL